MVTARASLIGFALASAALLGLSQPANADGMSQGSVKQQEPFRWTGIYLGLNGGAVLQAHEFSGFVPAASVMIPAARALEASIDNGRETSTSFLGGVQGGYNWQSGRWVLGFEADFDWISGKKSRDTGLVTVGANTGRTVDEVSEQWLGTARARVGVLVDPRTLLYATGGLAVTRQEFSRTQTWNFADGCPSAGGGQQTCHRGSDSDTRTTYTFGAGFEVALFSNWTVKGEYLYVPGDDISFRTFNAGAAIQFIDHTANFSHMDILRLGLNYRF